MVTATTETINTGVVIQLAPLHRWAGSLWIVDEVRKWGVVAYAIIPGEESTACFRLECLEWQEFAIVGPVPFRLGPTKIVNEDTQP